MQPGDCFTIEPSIEQLHVGPDGEVGGGDIWKDGWTVVTKVGGPSRSLVGQQRTDALGRPRREHAARNSSTRSSSPTRASRS
jgi:hypothetical protein